MLYPIGLHRLPAQHRQSAATLDTGTPGHPQTAPERTKRQPQKWRQTERDTETAPTAEPPRDQTQKRNARRARASTTAAAETRPPADTQPHQSRRDRARAREPEARHCRPRTETDRDREKKSGKERERRENDSKTPLFSPSHRTPADQPPEPAPHRQTWTAAKTPPFSVLLLWSMRNQRRSTPVLTIRKAGTVHIFTTSPTPKIWLCTLFSTPLSFSPKPSPPKHTVHQRYISLQI